MDPNEQNLRPSFTNPFNITGLPAITLPCGFTKDNLPVGLQLAAHLLKKVLCYASPTPSSGQRSGILADQSFRSAEIEWLLLLSAFEDLKIHLGQCWLHGFCGRHFSLNGRIESLASFVSQSENFLLVEVFQVSIFHDYFSINNDGVYGTAVLTEY